MNSHILQELIKQLGLTYLDRESGLIAVENISDLQVKSTDGLSPASNCSYYALTKEFPQNNLHWLLPDDHHILIAGGPADYYLFTADGQVDKKTLGLKITEGERPIVVSPGGSSKAVRLRPDADYLLVASVVTPAWNENRVTYGAGQKFLDQYSGLADWATQEFLKELIGPNWITQPES